MKKGDTPMEPVTETITDRAAILSPKQVRDYMEPMLGGKPVKTARTGHTEYNNGAILVKSRHPLDQCLRRGIIEDHHADSGKRIMTIRDCAFSRSSGRIYNDLGEGDSGIDAATLFTNTRRLMTARQWGLIEIVCFTQPDIDGNYFSEADYAALYRLAPNIQSAFDALDTALGEAREAIKKRIEDSAKPRGA